MEPNIPTPVDPVVAAAIARLHSAAPAVAPLTLKLPLQIMTKADVSRLGREVDGIAAFFASAAIKGATTKTVPQASQQLTALINDNGLNLLKESDRNNLVVFLKFLREKAPIVHASFATDPKPDFLMKIVGWFQTEAHPHVLLQVGLRPDIAAGCVIRTANKYFDFSFKKHFEASKAKLGASLRTTV